MRGWYVSALLILGLTTGCARNEGARSKTIAAEKILADDTLFSREFAAEVHKLRSDIPEGTLGTLVPAGKRPTIAAIKKKYGDPERITKSHRGPSVPGMTDAIDTVYWYGTLGLGVPTSSTTNTVEWLTIEPGFGKPSSNQSQRTGPGQAEPR